MGDLSGSGATGLSSDRGAVSRMALATDSLAQLIKDSWWRDMVNQALRADMVLLDTSLAHRSACMMAKRQAAVR